VKSVSRISFLVTQFSNFISPEHFIECIHQICSAALFKQGDHLFVERLTDTDANIEAG